MMRKDNDNAVFGSLAASIGGPRGHRSCGDEAVLSAAVAAAGKQLASNKSSKGWNNSTRASPLWKQRLQDKENGRVPVTKKFQHVQTKLNAPIFQQRHQQGAGGHYASGTVSEGGPLQTSSCVNFADPPHGQLSAVLEDDALSPAMPLRPDFITTRRRSRSTSPIRGVDPLDFLQPPADEMPSPGNGDSAGVVARQIDAAGPVLTPGRSPHPSVAELYRYANEVRTPSSAVSNVPVDSAAVEYHDRTEAGETVQDEDLTDSFDGWLISKGMDVAPLPEAALARLRALWSKAKEAVQLQALVKQLKESSLSEHCGTVPVATQDTTAQADQEPQEWLADAEERAAQLALPDTPSSSPPDSMAEVGFMGYSYSAPPLASELSPASHPGKTENTPEAASQACSEEPAIGIDMSPTDDDAASASVASWTCPQEKELDGVTSAKRDTLAAASPDLSPKETPCSQIVFSPGFSSLSQGSALSNAANAQNVLGVSVPVTDDGLHGSPGATPTQSAGLSFASRLPQPVAFDAWAKGQQRSNTPTTSVCQPSPQTPGAASVPSSSRWAESVSKPPATLTWDKSPLSTPPQSATCAKPTHVSTGSAQLRSNPLFEFDSPASTMSMTLPERTDALPGLAATPSPVHQPPIPSLASTPMSDPGDSLSGVLSPMGTELDSPGVACSGLFRTTDFGDMPTPVAGACSILGAESPTASPVRQLDAASSSQSETQAPSFSGMPDAAGSACASPSVSSSVGCGPTAMAEEPESMEESDEAQAAEAVELHPLGPWVADEPSASPEDGGPTAEDNTVDPELCYTTDLATSTCGMEALPSPAVGSPSEPAVASEGQEAEQEQGKAQESAGGITAPMAADPVASQPATSPASSEGCEAVEPASADSNGSKNATGLRIGSNFNGFRSLNFPNTPTGNCAASPTSTLFATPLEAFPSPHSATSLATGLQRTGLRMWSSGSTPSSQAPAGGATPKLPEFSFGMGQRQSSRVAARPAAQTPDLALGNGGGDRPGGAAAAAPALGIAAAGAIPFGSPLPLIQLTPVQMRALDRLASDVLAAINPEFNMAEAGSGPSSPDGPAHGQGKAETTVAARRSAPDDAVSFGFAQLLANLKSPMPVAMAQRHQSRRNTPGASEAEVNPGSQAEDGAANSDDGYATGDASAPTASSPMPAFSKLMDYLHTSRTTALASGAPAVASLSPQLPTVQSDAGGEQGCGASADKAKSDAVSDAVATAAVFSFAHFLAHLRAPRNNVANPAAHPSPLAAVTLGVPAGIDSPVTAGGAQDSPATSEAASFGFSTAAKQMESRITPSTTPGHAGMSFVRWARTPLSFQLDIESRTGGRDRASHTPGTPFSFGGNLHQAGGSDEATPAFGGHRRIVSNEALPSPGQHLKTPAVSRGALSPAFSFGMPMAKPPAGEGTPTAMLDLSASPALSYGPAPSLGFWGLHAGGTPGFPRGSPTPSEAGFTFGNCGATALATPLLAGLAGAAANAAAELTSDESNPRGLQDVAAALEQVVVAMSPTLFGVALASSPGETPGEVQPNRVQTPNAGTTEGEAATGFAPALGPSAFWSALLAGGLHSPMPAAVHGRLYGGVPETQHEESPGQLTGSPPSLDLLPTENCPEATPGSMGDLVVPFRSSSSGAAAQVPLAKPQRSPDTGTDARSVIGGAAPLSQDDAPPPYEDLPELIARGLCLSVSASVPVTTREDVKDSAIKTQSSMGENPTPYREPDTVMVRAEIAAAAFALPVGPGAHGFSPDGRLFKPSNRVFTLPTSAADSGVADGVRRSSPQLVIESVSDSNRSAAVEPPSTQAGRTTEPMPTPSRMVHTAYSGCDAPVPTTGPASVHISPVFSFGGFSEDRFSNRSAATRTLESAGPGEVKQQDLPAQDTAAAPVGENAPAVAAQRPSTSVSQVQTDPSNPAGHDGPDPPVACFLSPRITQRRNTFGGQQSPVTFSYLGSGTPPATPPTTELASVNRSFGPLSQRNAAATSHGGGGQFWAPSPSGAVASSASGERVTLEASNRRIRANADLLLDFQGSPGQPVTSALAASVSGAVTPRVKPLGAISMRPSPILTSPFRKSWDVAISHPANLATNKITAAQAMPHAGAAIAQLPATAAAASGGTANRIPDVVAKVQAAPAVPAGTTDGQGPPLQQLVAAGIDNTFTSAAASLLNPAGHKPISQRLGLWPSAVWEVQPTTTPGEASAVSADPVLPVAPAEAHVRHAAVQAQAATPPPAAAAAKPVLASRDVQTTPGLENMARLADEKVEVLGDSLRDGPTRQAENKAPAPIGSIPQPAPAHQHGLPAARKPGFRSRIPTIAPPVVRSAADSGSSNAVAAASGGRVSTAGEESEQSASTERVMRRQRQLSTAAGSGGPQRVPVKGAPQRGAGQGGAAAGPAVVGEEEMRRRARVLGVRISPYLRGSKAARVRVPESQPAKKG